LGNSYFFRNTSILMKRFFETTRFLQQRFYALHLRMLFAPFFGEFSGDCGGEDGLAETFEYGRYLLKALFHGVNARHDGVQLGDNAFLFVKGWQG